MLAESSWFTIISIVKVGEDNVWVMFRHVLLAVDGSDCSIRAAEHASAIAEKFGSTVTLVHVEPLPMLPYPVSDPGAAQEYIDLQEDAGALIREAAIAQTRPTLDKRGIKFDRAEAKGPAGEAIIATAQAIDADLIVVGHRGLSAVKSFFLGSTSERVVHGAKCSVLVVR
jgi:nucleotide-binding universal stress UspA family protein